MTALSPERYDAWYRTQQGRWVGDCEYELLRKCLAIRSDESILDVGCGTGFFTRRFARNHCSTVIGVDPDPATIWYASRHAETIEAYIVARGEALPFPSRSFDLSISITALCFVNDQMRFLREMARVTRRRVAVGLLNRRGHGEASCRRFAISPITAFLAIRWLRPEFQIPASGQPQTRAAEQLEIDTGEEVAVAAKPGARRPWPATLPVQVKAVAEVLTAARAPLADGAIAACFIGRGPWKKRLPQIIDTLVAVGRVRRRKDGLAVIA